MSQVRTHDPVVKWHHHDYTPYVYLEISTSPVRADRRSVQSAPLEPVKPREIIVGMIKSGIIELGFGHVPQENGRTE